jgi:hypothetical protein
MGFDIGGSTIAASGTGISLNGYAFDGNGYATSGTLAGYSGFKDIAGNDFQASTGSGWVINNVRWNSGLNTSTGVFTCPVAGLYAVGFNGIANGGSSVGSPANTYGYAAFAKNGAINYWIHWNLAATNAWNQAGGSSVFSCAVNDTLSFYINQSPTPVANAFYGGQNYGWYAHEHHAIWCVFLG